MEGDMGSSNDKPGRRRSARKQGRADAKSLVIIIAKRVAIAVLLLLTAAGVLGTSAVAGFAYAAWRDLPALAEIQPKFLATSFVYDRNGEQVTGLAGPENRIPVSISEVSEYLQMAFVAHEDRYFYSHQGIVLRAIARAVHADLTGGRFQGASTITQQLARTAFLTLDRTMIRKIQEAILAIQLERSYTKSEILEMYLNGINLAHGAYGVEAAARNFFGKSAAEVNLAEAALITGIAKNPTPLSPYRNLEGARQQMQVVLNQMVQQGMVSREEADEAVAYEFELPGLVSRTSYPYPFFVDYVLDQLLNVHKLDPDLVYSGGLHIYTTLDQGVQTAAQEAATKYSEHFPTNDKGERAEIGMVLMENDTGYLRAIVGGVEHNQLLQFNYATQSKRQPGSAFKPIVAYTPAVDLGYAPSTVVDDAPAVWFTTTGEAWHPKNFDNRFRGLITFRLALERSVNLAAAKVFTWVGIRTGIDYAQRMGIDSLVTTGTINDVTWSLSMGALTHGVSPLELTRAYAVLGNRGVKVQPLALLRVLDKAGNVIIENLPRREVVLSEQTAWLVTDMLVGVIHQPHGTGVRAVIPGWKAAGKTGTSSDYADAWFAGYTTVHSGAVWLGYPKERASMGVQFGGMYPALIWREAMIAAHEGLTPVDFERPKDIVTAIVCSKSGRLPGPHCSSEHIVTEVFLKGTEPRESCDIHVAAKVCIASPGHLASPFCPEEWTMWQTFIRRPEPYSPWVTRTGVQLVPEDADQEIPTTYCSVHQPVEEFEPDQVIAVTMRADEFDPRTINVATGAKVRLVLTSVGRTYSMAIDGYGVSAVVAAGNTVYLDFVADKTGTFNYFCNMDIGDGKSTMTGRLVVGN